MTLLSHFLEKKNSQKISLKKKKNTSKSNIKINSTLGSFFPRAAVSLRI